MNTTGAPGTAREIIPPANMSEFFEAVQTIPLIRYALLAGVVSSLIFGVVGSFVVTRRIGYIAAAIAHGMLGGIGAAIYFGRTYDLPWLTPTFGAVVSSLLFAGIIGWVSLRSRDREDTIIGAIWAFGMAAGILFIQYAPGKNVNLESFLLGNILLTSKSDVIATVTLGVIVLTLVALFYHKLVAVCFDEEFASLRGVSSHIYFLLLLVITALSMVLLVRVTGIVLSLALLVLPAATASRFFRRLWLIILVSIVLSLIYNTGGLMVSFQLDTLTGPFIVIVASVVYGLTFLVKRKGM